MYRKVSFAVLAFAGLIIWRCASDPVSSPPAPPLRELSATEKNLVGSGNEFGLKLFKEVLAEEGDKNVFISPLSVAMALGMTYNGANGETRDAMQQALELNGLSLEEINQSFQSLIALLTQLDPAVKFQIANSIWYRQEYPVKDDFLSRNREYFNAEVAGLDFGAPGTLELINNWVSESTNGKIETILDKLDPDLVLLLINAIYFKGNWTYQFDEADTKDDTFHLPDGSESSCRMMEQETDLSFMSNDLFAAVDLPYGNQLFSMTILLPHPNVELETVMAELTSENWASWMERFHTQEGMLYMPKFKLEYFLKLNDILIAMGMGPAFDVMAADFSNMCDCGLYIGEVRHKTFVQVNEEGTEAAAVTSVSMLESGPLAFVVNRPFIFVIRDSHSGSLLFMGRIVEPEWE